MNLEQKVAELNKRNRLAEDGGGAKRRERQHREGKMSARERVEFLLDEGTFEETDKLVTHRCNDFGMPSRKFTAMDLLRATGALKGDWCMCLRRTSPCLAGRSRRRMQRRS
jgi:propionyl-CoA carboxylase beta chain